MSDPSAVTQGACHCGAVRWRLTGDPGTVTACNCTLCRRYGALWAYDFEDGRIAVEGETRIYSWGDRDIAFHFCAACGCMAYWRGLKRGEDGRRRMAVNLRLAEPDAVAAQPVRHFDGFQSWRPVPRDTHTVGDLWF